MCVLVIATAAHFLSCKSVNTVQINTVNPSFAQLAICAMIINISLLFVLQLVISNKKKIYIVLNIFIVTKTSIKVKHFVNSTQ